MRKTGLSFFLYLIFLNTLGQSNNYSLLTERAVNYQTLKDGFILPPLESRLRCYWWWLNSMATKESITRDLEEMKAKGYGGASIVDAGSSSYDVARKTPAGPVFMSPEWMELYKHAVKEADRVGIELTINIQSGWNPGGPSITPEFALKKIVWTETTVSGGKHIRLSLNQPEMNLYYKDIAVQAIKKRGNELLKNDAIKYWDIKSFNKRIGWKGIYPLYQLREDYPESGTELAVKKSEIINLTGQFKNGTLDWDAPQGEWTIIRYGYTCTGARTSTTSDGWNGLSVDHLSPEAFDLFSKTVIIPLIETAKSAGNSVSFLQTDSWEMDVVSWTANFPEEFKKYRNYDLLDYLPVFTGRIVENRDVSDRFLHDFRKTIGDCIIDYHYKPFRDLAHSYGMGIHPESGGPHSAPVDALRTMAINDFPQGEFWAMANTHRIKDDERLSVRQSACVAHTNGIRFVAAEGPTSIGPQWERSPKDLKGNIDRVFCSGVNRIEWHTFTSSPKEFGLPGNEYFAGTHLNPNVTWWKQAGDFISYLNRSSFMLQQGLFVADVLYYYGDDVPNFVFLKEDLPELKAGYDWDKCSKDIILDRLSFDGEKIVLPDGMSYRILMLAPEKSIDLAVLRKIEKLVNQGMTLFAQKPSETTGLTGFPEEDSELKDITDRLWGKIDGRTVTENHIGKGLVIWGRDINEVLAGMKIIPDFGFTSNQGNTALDYIHRNTDKQEIYFVTNRFSRREFNDFQYRYQTTLPNRYEEVECYFRVTGKVPELWDPISGKVTEILAYREENGQTIIPLHFEPEGSKFIVFRDSPPGKHIIEIRKGNLPVFPNFSFATSETPFFNVALKNEDTFVFFREPGSYTIKWSDGKTENLIYDKTLNEIAVSGLWGIRFDSKWGGPASVITDQLKSWTAFDNDSIKYYSGTATYYKTFSFSNKDMNNASVFLDLGNVQEMASVTINGHFMQVKWCAPYLFDISPYIQPGVNQLEVEVVNMWPNRLIGDSKLPEDKRLTRTNVTKFNSPDSEKYLRESGLIGPVKLILMYHMKI
jgi:hypothetical protein